MLSLVIRTDNIQIFDYIYPKLCSLKQLIYIVKMFRNFMKILRNLKTVSSTSFLAGAFINKDKLKPIDLKDSRQLTHGFLIQQASSVTVNAASQLLTQTVNAIVDISSNYKNAMLELLGILEDSKSPNARYLEGELNDLLIEARAKVNDFKKELTELYSFMEYVEKVSESSAEAAYLVGAEYVSTTLGERIHSAKVKLEETKRELESLEQELLNVQKDIILNDVDNK